MDFASEPIFDSVPPPARSAPRAPQADDNGQTFDDHLEAANETAPERPAPRQTEAKSDTPPVESKPAPSDETDESSEALDADVALLGGPPPVAPPMTAPVIVQIAASQPAQQQQAPTEAADGEAAPIDAPEAAAPTAPAQHAEARDGEAPVAPAVGKSAQAEVKPSAPETAPVQSAQQAPGTQEQQQAAVQTPATAPVAVEELPPAIRQAIAATIAPAPQATPQPTQRSAKAVAPADEAKAAPSAPDGKPEAPTPNGNVRTQAPNAAAGNAVVADIATPVSQTQASAPDLTQIAQSNAVTTTASQASTHVQHAAAETGAQRSAPAAAQVSREIIRRFDGGNTSFELRLDPAELGRVEVRMEVSRDHRVTAVITADNPQALTELARNARELEQQLQSAGLQLGENGLSFDLRQGAQGGESEQANNSARANGGEDALSEQQPAPVARPIGYERWRGVRVDMMV